MTREQDKALLPQFPPMPPTKLESWNLSQALAWEVLWTWCHNNGLREHADREYKLFRQLDGPQTIAQWILDLKAEAAK